MRDKEFAKKLLWWFPWLADDNDEEVSGADVINDLVELYQHLIQD